MAIETALVVDDSRSARYVLQQLLERQHIHVEGVDSAEEALSYLREIRPDVVFMDEMMPGMDGQEAVDRLAADPRTAGIPIVMYTGRDYAADAPPLQRGVIGVLSKPFTPQDVDALLAKLGGVVSARPDTPRLKRRPVAVMPMQVVQSPAHPDTNPESLRATAPLSTSEDLARCVNEAVATEMSELRAYLAEEVKSATRLALEQLTGEFLEEQMRMQTETHEPGWKHALDGMRHAQNRFEEQLLEQRIPRLLDLQEQRLKWRMDGLQKSLTERIENGGLGAQQRIQVSQIARTAATEAAHRPARESAHRVVTERLLTDISALNLQLDRLRRRFSVVVTSAVIATLSAVALGYLFGRMG